MRNVCGAPIQLPGMSVSKFPPAPAVRAYRAPPANVLNAAHGGLLKLLSKPICWYGSPVNVARNSSEDPAVTGVGPETSVPSAVSVPPAMVATPPVLHGVLVQPVGSVVPENSLPVIGARLTSPSPVCVMNVLPLVVPVPKSDALESPSVTTPVVKFHTASLPIALPAASFTVPATVAV